LHPEEWNALAVMISDTSYKARYWADEKLSLPGNDF
jgi:hypothetical protein